MSLGQVARTVDNNLAMDSSDLWIRQILRGMGDRTKWQQQDREQMNVTTKGDYSYIRKRWIPICAEMLSLVERDWFHRCQQKQTSEKSSNVFLNGLPIVVQIIVLNHSLSD